MSDSVKNFIAQNNQFIDGGTDTMYWKLNVGGEIDWMGIPNCNATINRTKSNNSLTYPGALVYEATYNFDENGLRYTPGNTTPNKKYSLFFGDSQTFGEGLNDDQTLPFLFQKYSSDFNSFNFGFPGACPSNMLGWLKEDKIQSKFKNVEGEVFYVIRDGDIRNINGLEESVTSNEFREEHFKKLFNIFKESNKIIKNISPKLNFNVVIIPLTFCYNKIITALSDLDINLLNFYFIDLGYLTNNSSRFLDGAHSYESNNVLAKLISKNYNKVYNPIELFENSFTDNYAEVIERVEIKSFFMHYFTDFPKDDAGVVITDILNLYKGTDNEQELFKVSEKKYKQKIELLDSLKEEKIFFENTYDMFIKDKLTINKEKLYNNKFFNKLSQEYKNYFIKIYIDLYKQTPRL